MMSLNGLAKSKSIQVAYMFSKTKKEEPQRLSLLIKYLVNRKKLKK